MGLQLAAEYKSKTLLAKHSKRIPGLVPERLYFYIVQRWQTDKGGIAKIGGKYVRQGHVGFVRPTKDGFPEQFQYSGNGSGGFTGGSFLDWLRSSVYNARPANKSQSDKIFVRFFGVK